MSENIYGYDPARSDAAPRIAFPALMQKVYTWMTLALLTVFMGSMLAYRTDILKKRLAYSTVSQLSYILFGLAVLNPMAVTGSLLHVIFHAFSKALAVQRGSAAIGLTVQSADIIQGNALLLNCQAKPP